MVESLQLLANITASSSTLLDEWLQLGGSSLRSFSIILAGNPLLGCSLEVVGNLLVCDNLIEKTFNTLLHLLVSHHHTETELAEVLEQRVSECRTLSLLVCCIWSRWYRS